MTRLIDADAFAEVIKDVIRKQKYQGLELDRNLTVADVLECVVAELDGTGLGGFKNAPTVDAIPVEWLEMTYPLHGVSGTEAYFRNASAVKDILRNWELSKRYAQEAQE